MPDILITGADSFIGKNFIRHSVNRSVREVSLLEKKPDEIPFDKFGIVIHLAAIVHQSDKKDKDKYFRVNRDLCIEVALNAKKAGVKQFIFLSSIKVYGEFGNRTEPWDENSECHPTDYYGKSKLEAEIALRKIESPEFIVSVIRTPVVYGEGVKANILSIIRLVDRIPILPLAGLNNARNFTFVENLVAYLDRIIERSAGGTFIVMDCDPVSTTDLVRYISAGLGRRIFLFKLPSFVISAAKRIYPKYFERLFGSLLLNNYKTKEILEFEPPYSIRDGLSKMMEYYQKNQK